MRPYIAVVGTVTARQDGQALESFIRASKASSVPFGSHLLCCTVRRGSQDSMMTPNHASGLWHSGTMHCAILVAVLVFAGGCAGGGGTNHTPPERVVAGERVILSLEFSVWGAGFGNLSKRYTQIACRYRQAGQPGFQAAPAKVLSSSRERMQTQFTIPPQSIQGSSGTLEYHFEFLFDGHRNRNHTNSVPIVKPPSKAD